MANKAADVFMDRWLNDPSFSHQLKADPKTALKSCGIEPDEHLVKPLKDVDSGTPVEEMQKRVSKAAFFKGILR